jgi:hypothetical protein
MASCGYWFGGTTWDEPARRPGVGKGHRRGVTQAPMRRRRKRR